MPIVSTPCRRPLAVAAVALVTIAAAACHRVPAPGKVGERIEYRGYALTVLHAERAEDFPGARRARQGDTLVAVEVLVESNTSDVKVSPEHMWVAEPGGKAFKPHKTGREPILQENNAVPKGGRAQGWLTFEVPSGTTTLRFVNELPKEFDHAELKVDLP